MAFVCPICKGELTDFEKFKKCPLGHSFDRAKEGYYNLLMARGGGTHGDNDAMVKARRDFLLRGYYEPLREAVTRAVIEFTPSVGRVLDAGLGEGYYTDAFEKALRERDGDSLVFGFDISKCAVKYAAKRNPKLSLAVASSYSIPAADGSFNTVISIFSPLAREEIKRVLKVGGVFIFVYPGRRHLMGLKSAVYDTPRENEPMEPSLRGFGLVRSDRLSYEVTVSGNDAVSELFMMTPYAYRTGNAERERLSSLDAVATELEFYVDIYRKEG